MPSEARLQVGEHEITFEPPDRLFTRILGDISGPDLSRLFDEVKERAGSLGRVFWMVDISRLGVVSAEARRLGVQTGRFPGLEGVAVFGGGFYQRLAATLALNAAKLIRRGQVMTPVAFVRDEAEARAWAASLRERIEAAGRVG